jgi:diguanylate cyclase (GGDEF)-like protein
VGELSILDQLATSAHVIAADPCRVLVVTEDSFWNLLGSSHAFALNLLLKLAERLRSNNESVSENAQLRQRFERAALFDPLTNVNNRRWLESALPRLVERHTMGGKPLSLAVIEIDAFGLLSDRFGHSLGDRLLAAVAITLRTRLRPLDQIARHSSGGFGAVETAQRLREAIRATRPFGPSPENLPPISASIGLAELQPPQSAAVLFARGEAALHRAKQSGPNSLMS